MFLGAIQIFGFPGRSSGTGRIATISRYFFKFIVFCLSTPDKIRMALILQNESFNEFVV